MTILSTVQEIKQTFPVLLEAQIIKDLDRAQKDFVDETDYLETSASLANLSTNVAWALPADFNKLKEILLYDVNNDPLYLEDFQLAYEIELGNIYFRSTNDTPISVMPSGIITVLIIYYQKPTALALVTDSFSINDGHVLGVSAKLFEEYYSRFPVDIMVTRGVSAGEIIHNRDFNAVKYWGGKAQEYRVKAKRWVNKKDETGDGSPINYGMAGKFELTRRIQSGSSTILQPITFVYSKYVKFLVTSISVTQSGGLYGFTSCTASLNIATNTVTFTGNFSDLTWVDSNNSDYNVTIANSTTLAVQWSSITGTIVVEIFEK